MDGITITIGLGSTITDAISWARIMAAQGTLHRRYTAPGVDVCGSMARVAITVRDGVATGVGLEVLGSDDVDHYVPWSADGMAVHECHIHG